jgi:hypothetical protein
MKKILLSLNLLLFISRVFSQNLVLNPDFEIYGNVTCGWSATAADFAAAIDSWTSPTEATPDIFSTLILSSCTNYQPHSTSIFCNGWQPPHSGNIFCRILHIHIQRCLPGIPAGPLIAAYGFRTTVHCFNVCVPCR